MSGGFVLEIEELAIEGVEASERHMVARALEREVRRLVATRGIPAGLAGAGELAVIRVPDAGIVTGDGAIAVGTKAGRALYGALGR